MKKIYRLSVLVALFAVLLPFLFIRETEALKPTPTPTPTPDPLYIEAAPAPDSIDSKLYFTVLFDDEVKCVSMADYLPNVLAAEMPAQFEYDALKAQAVAARTYIAYCTQHVNPNHPEANICTKAGCCLAYNDDATLRGMWGASYEDNMQRVKQAVLDTDGEILYHEDEPILASFHSSSDGMTENSVELWSDVPYLKAVESPETAEDVPDFEASVEVLKSDFRETILRLYPETPFTDNPSEWIGECVNDDSGRVHTMTVCGQLLTGAEVRKLFSLRSTAFTITENADTFVFTTRGYGHGLGLSQYGANVMAQDGEDYRKILYHYYPETVIYERELEVDLG